MHVLSRHTRAREHSLGNHSGKIAEKGEGHVTALRSRRAMSKRTVTLWKARRRAVAELQRKKITSEGRRGRACALEYTGVSACVSISWVFNSGPRTTARFAPSSASRRTLWTRGTTPSLHVRYISLVIAPTCLTGESSRVTREILEDPRPKPFVIVWFHLHELEISS
jgi:hypothetical protein